MDLDSVDFMEVFQPFKACLEITMNIRRDNADFHGISAAAKSVHGTARTPGASACESGPFSAATRRISRTIFRRPRT